MFLPREALERGLRRAWAALRPGGWILLIVYSSPGRDLDAAVFVTMHLGERANSLLPQILTRAGRLPAVHPADQTAIRKGMIYIAPPDYHLLLRPGEVHLGHGPRENRQRPCINVMFRSAAAAYGDRVAGVVLTGMLDDGGSGLWEIQQHGGATIVQDPQEAAFPSMPENAIRSLNVQYIVKLDEMPGLLTRLTMGQATRHSPPLESSAGHTPITFHQGNAVRAPVVKSSFPKCSCFAKYVPNNVTGSPPTVVFT